MPRSLACLVFSLLLGLAPAFASEQEAETLINEGDPRAATVVADLARTRPKDPGVRILQLRLLMLQRETKRAVAEAERLVKDAPDHAMAHLWLGMAYGSRIGEVGMFTQASMAPKIRAAFERAAELDPAMHQARLALVEYYLQAPGIVGGSEAKARAQVEALARVDPAFGRYGQARLAMHEGNQAAAREHMLAAYAARPREASFRMGAGLAHQQAEAWDEAFAVFEAWTADEPRSAAAWYQLGRTAALSGRRLEQGIAAFQRVLALYPQPGAPAHQHAWYRKGQLHALAGDKAAARQAFERALALEPGHADAKAALKAL